MKAWLAGAAALALTGCVSVDYSEEAGYAPFAEEGRDALRVAEAWGDVEKCDIAPAS